MKTSKIRILIMASIFIIACVLAFPPVLSAFPRQETTEDIHIKNIQEVYEMLQKYYVDEVDPKILYKGAMEGMLNSLKDPYTVFIEKSSIAGVDLQDVTKGFFGGIGVTITKANTSTPEKPAYLEVLSPIEGTPGWRAGLQPGDLIIKIGDISTADITMEEILSKLRGPIGTKVDITVLRGKSLEFPLSIVRDKIEVPTVKYAKIEPDIAYVRLITFNPLTAPRMEEAVVELQKRGCTKLILDLRNNTGGIITGAVNVVSSFIDSGTVVSTKSRIPNQNMVFTVNKNVTKFPQSMPIIVLINKGSASASEIVAGALKDYKRAYLVGETTYGKGVVQQIFDINQDEGFKMTVSKYYTPSDANIDKQGIPPDFEIKTPELSEEEETALIKLFADNKIASYVEKNKSLNKTEIENFAKNLSKEYKLTVQLLKRLIVQEYNRKRISPPVYDLEYDEQLRKSVDIIKNTNIFELLKKTKTIHMLQDEAEQKQAQEKTAS
ncbi:Peptidase, S41 family [Treponema phagedenis]|uniref:Peptidase, S41 family n=1 Tax=Treponema phagedenis TaxID=162 RepID=A0A0B7H0A6_TREPH|nr:S41 family peptidase [Treponema phagedenis]CEM62356.1 Peptidase, S41 family [Treponema phagedenis]